MTGMVTLTVSAPDAMNLPPAMMKIGADPVIIDISDDSWNGLTSSAPRMVTLERGVDEDQNKWTFRAEPEGHCDYPAHGC